MATARKGPHESKAPTLSGQKARQGVVTGRVLAVLGTSVILISVIYAIIWFSHAGL